MAFLEIKPTCQGASEHHPNHCHMEREGSKTHPVAIYDTPRSRPGAPYQHVVLTPHGGDVCSMQRNVESVHSGHYGRQMGIQCNVACVSIEIQIICNLF